MGEAPKNGSKEGQNAKLENGKQDKFKKKDKSGRRIRIIFLMAVSAAPPPPSPQDLDESPEIKIIAVSHLLSSPITDQGGREGADTDRPPPGIYFFCLLFRG